MTRELVHGRLGEGPGDDDVDPPPEVPGHIRDRFPSPETDVLAGEVHRGAPELGHAHLQKVTRVRSDGYGAVIAYAVVATFVIVKVTGLVLGIRVKSDQEEVGLDLAVHGEVAYQS